MDIIWLLIMETRSFTFRAVGTSAEQVAKALIEGWKVHCAQTDADPDYLRENVDSVNISPMNPGVCERDMTPLTEYQPFPANVAKEVLAAFELLET